MTCCAYYQQGKCTEPYSVHIRLALAAAAAVKRYYARPLERLQRRLGVGGFDLLAAAVVLHDAGKLVAEYQSGDRRRYRHEVISAHIAYRAVEKLATRDAAVVTALAVMLHHEPISFSALVTGLGYRRLPVMEVYAMVRRSDLRPAESCDPASLSKEIRGLRLGDPAMESTAYSTAEAMAQQVSVLADHIEEVEEALAEILAEAIAQSPQRWRLLAAALLHPLALADQLAAQCSPYRGGEGTWLTKRALGLDKRPRAEPLPGDPSQLCAAVCQAAGLAHNQAA